MKKFLVALLVFVLVIPTVVASGPSPQGPPPPRGSVPPLGPKEMGGIPALDLADQPVPEELASMELSFEKRDKGHEFVRSLTDEQRASIGQLLADNSSPVLGKVGDPVPSIQSAEELGRHVEALKVLLPEMSRWQDAISAGLAGILTSEQYALYQDSLLPPPVQMADIEPQASGDCYDAYYYGYYAYLYSYYQYTYAYYAYVYDVDLLALNLYELAYEAYILDYNGYIYAYYAYYYYYNATYAYYAHYYLLRGGIKEYYSYNLAYDIYSLTGDDYVYYAYYYSYYGYIYKYYATYYAYYCYVEGGCSPIPNGDFEDGHSDWYESSTHGWDLIVNSLPVTPVSGSWAVWEGGDYEELSLIYQNVPVPSSDPYLGYCYWIASDDICGYYDYGVVQVNSDIVALYDLCEDNNTGGWVCPVIDLSSYAGQYVDLLLWAYADSSYNSNWFLDDVQWTCASSSSFSAETAPRAGVTDSAITAPRPGASEPSDQRSKSPSKAPPEAPRPLDVPQH